ncbi:dehydrogenase, partial [Candidatus Sumerlaeota bacterium]|nr:dehydrogenase [Candidatus Sumerlaeota bacterium]
MENFIECVRERSLPISDVFTHHRAVSSCHLCNIALLLPRKLKWDPEREDFVGDREASAMVGHKQRAPYAVL